MRVAQLMAGAPRGGAELFFERLCVALARAGEEVLPVIRRDAGRAARLRAGGLEPVQLGFGGRLDLLTRPRAGRALRRFRAEVAVAWMGRAAALAPEGPWTLVGRLGGTYDLGRFARCRHLVANTRGLQEWIIARGWPAARAHYVPNFVPDLAGAVPATLGWTPGRWRLLAMGRLHRNKGFDLLLAALARLPQAELAIAGEGPERAALEALARRARLADRVRFLGWREDTGALLAASDLLVCPSRGEPLGNVILEAFSAGRPVVAAAAAGPRELIDPGRNGVLVAPESGIALAAGIDSVLSNPAMEDGIARAGRRSWESAFSEAAVVTAWRDFLRQVAPA
jgi:glycosyltransferase involved in cell wall biosynthesis